MKVLQINATYGTGSTGEIVAGIGQVATQKGIEMYYACAVRPKVIRNEHIFVIGNAFDHKRHALYSRIFGRQANYSFLATKKLLVWINSVKPDIIHLHNLHNNYINISLLFDYVQKNKIQTVITLHDCWFFTGKCCHFLYDDCDRWLYGCGKCPRQRKEIPSYFFDRSGSEFSAKQRLIGENPYIHVVGCSHWLTDCAKRSLLADRVEKTIYNGIDLSTFKPVKESNLVQLCLKDKFVIIGFANKWLSDDNKETIDYITSNLPASMVLLLMGCSSKQIQRNQKDNVIMMGFVENRAELAEYYSYSDVFVNVTKVDSFPTVNIESLACGTPVITYDSGGSAETIDEATGMVVPYGDSRQLLRCIQKVKENGKSFYSENCRRRAEQIYDKTIRFKEYVDLYYKITENI